ncbi:hypothetical protein NDS46_13740 [Paenibacillus thiaminolyticus]|nr:hypothetical protein [Paenibacillus thiaminolyticus]WCF10837.1 hypothetical protein NDS46_13740 [Paenibacillus thiaminolyticus]
MFFFSIIFSLSPEVGEDYAAIRESDGSMVLVHLNQVISLHIQ